MNGRARFLAGAILLSLPLLLVAAPRAGATDCSTLPNPVYTTGSTAAKPLLAQIGRILAAQNPQVSLIYLGQGSCTGVDAILNGTPISGSGTTALSTWDATGMEQKCDLAAPGIVADVGISDVFATTCFQLPGGLPPTVADILGPVQTMTFVAPAGSQERAISAEAAYNIYGFGNLSGVPPWTDETLMFHRDDQSGTQRMIATAIGVPPTRWKGVVATSSTDLLSKLSVASNPSGAIGILASDVAQDNRTAVRVLAYRHFGQSCAYYPDSDEILNDKQNVRDGHYAIWGPLHLLTRLNGSGYPVSMLGAKVIGYLAGTTAVPPGLDLIMLEAQRHVVPQCAMRVKRMQELGPLASFAPSGSCGCYYEFAANGGTSCTACMASLDCPASAPVCSYGYCETQ
jgi:ABC-type phosphate transport system substrate-binding protein